MGRLKNSKSAASHDKTSGLSKQNTKKPNRSTNISSILKVTIDDRNKVIKEHKIRIKNIKKNYNELFDSVDKFDLFIQVLDARDPNACIYDKIEKRIKQSQKKVIRVINKIDLVPRDVVVSWIADLSKEEPTYAICATDSENSSKLLKRIIEANDPNAKSVGVIGIKSVGKTTICSLLGDISTELPSYLFCQAKEELCLLGGCENEEYKVDFAIDVIARSTSTEGQTDLFSVYEIEPTDEPEEVIKVLSNRWGMSLEKGSEKFTSDLIGQKQYFFCVPPMDMKYDCIPEQETCLRSSPDDYKVPYIQFSPGERIEERDMEGEVSDDEMDQ